MNIDDQTKEAAKERELGGDDHVEVLVEDLFIEEYQAPLELAPDVLGRQSEERGRIRAAVEPLRANARSLLGGLLAVGGLAVATLFLAGRRRKVSTLSRWFLRLGLARG